MSENVLQKSYFATVSECKRLIAKGVARHPLVLKALESGIVAVAKGTTNSYIVEELLGTPIHKPDYCMGTSQPRKPRHKIDVANKMGDLVFDRGRRIENVTAVEMLEKMGPGDVFIKGANALNYWERVAGLLIGNPTGGTIGASLGRITARRITLLIPVGLEKSIPASIAEVAQEINLAGKGGSGPTLWPVRGEIVTEIEAISILTGAKSAPMAAGGINGGEGGLWLACFGSESALEKLDKLVDEIVGEPPFGESSE